MNPILRAAAEAQRLCAEAGLRFCVIGGIAVGRWGQPRATLDVDLTVVVELGDEERVVRALLASFMPRLPGAYEFALRSRVVLVKTSAGQPIDIALGGLPFEHRAVARASDFDVGDGVVLRTCSAEDLLVYKVFAGRERDWADVETILVRQRGRLDLALVRAELTPLLELKEDDAALPKLESLITKLYER